MRKTYQLSVVMMKEYCSSIPKGKVRQKLAATNHILSVRFSRSTNGQKVTNRTFKVAHLVVLQCDSTRHNLIRCADQLLDGEKAIDRKGALYLCESLNSHKVLLILDYKFKKHSRDCINRNHIGREVVNHLICIVYTLVLYNGLIPWDSTKILVQQYRVGWY